MSSRRLRVAVVGLNFGEHWLDAYRAHPDVERVVICDPDPAALSRVGDAHGIEDRHPSLAAVLDDDRIDAVHLLTPLDLHAEHSLAVLAAGKHCAVAVTAALAMEDLHAIVRAQETSGRNYMMMETAAFSATTLHLRDMVRSGEFGEVTFGRGEHHQNMEGWPGYWVGLPPLWYATHALGPLLTILDARPSRVRAMGTGSLTAEMQARWANPFPAEVAMVEVEGAPVVLEITRSLFSTARAPIESLSIYGGRRGFDWGRTHDEHPLMYSMGGLRGRGREVVVEPFVPRDPRAALPAALQGFPDTIAGPVHEFIDSIMAERRPTIDAVVAAQWTATGLAAHDSALVGGAVMDIPRFC